jgi:GTP-binding protein YchF
VLAANYPFATIEPNVGVVGVPDPGSASSRRSSARPGSSRDRASSSTSPGSSGAPPRGGAGQQVPQPHPRVRRDLPGHPGVPRRRRHPRRRRGNPADDISTIQTELILADLQTVEKAVPRLEKEARLKKEGVAILEAVREAQKALEAGTPISATSIDRDALRELMLMTAKPYLYVFNCDADELADDELLTRMRELVAPAEAIFLDAKFEAELVELGDEDEAREMLAEMGVEQPGLDVLARVGFETLGLQTYLTAGPKESRAWTIRKGATAPEAAGVIHTDFQRGFIKAEIVSYADLMEAGSMAAAKAAGKVRIEGKDYVMADGDVVEFRFNV